MTTFLTIYLSLHLLCPPLISALSLTQSLAFSAWLFLSSALKRYSSTVSRMSYFVPNLYGLHTRAPQATPFFHIWTSITAHNTLYYLVRRTFNRVELAPGYRAPRGKTSSAPKDNLREQTSGQHGHFTTPKVITA